LLVKAEKNGKHFCSTSKSTLAKQDTGLSRSTKETKANNRVSNSAFSNSSTVALEQAAQGGCGVSSSGDTQDPPGQGPRQPAVGNPALAEGWTR